MSYAVLNRKGECVSVADDPGDAADRASRFDSEYPDEAPFIVEEAGTYKQAISMMRDTARRRRSPRSGE